MSASLIICLWSLKVVSCAGLESRASTQARETCILPHRHTPTLPLPFVLAILGIEPMALPMAFFFFNMKCGRLLRSYFFFPYWSSQHPFQKRLFLQGHVSPLSCSKYLSMWGPIWRSQFCAFGCLPVPDLITANGVWHTGLSSLCFKNDWAVLSHDSGVARDFI
jgi:hypothetical protein